jgi:hypothetical protein
MPLQCINVHLLCDKVDVKAVDGPQVELLMGVVALMPMPLLPPLLLLLMVLLGLETKRSGGGGARGEKCGEE